MVTGANSGIGRAVAIALGQAGAEVAVNWVGGEDAAQAVVEEIGKAGGKAMAVKADVASEDDVVGMFKAVIGAFGTLDILVANAGLQRDSARGHVGREQRMSGGKGGLMPQIEQRDFITQH